MDADGIRGGKPRRVLEVARYRRQIGRAVDGWKNPKGARALRGASQEYDAPPGGPSWAIQPFEVALRFPADPFNYAAQATIAQGAASAVLLTVTVPANVLGVLRALVVYSTLPAGIEDLTEFGLLIDGTPRLGLQVPGAAVTGAASQLVLPKAQFEDPEFVYNVRIQPGQVMQISAGRAAGVDPAAYTYVFRLKGWYWPKYRRRGF
jgi:hypothetical protein